MRFAVHVKTGHELGVVSFVKGFGQGLLFEFSFGLQSDDVSCADFKVVSMDALGEVAIRVSALP